MLIIFRILKEHCIFYASETYVWIHLFQKQPPKSVLQNRYSLISKKMFCKFLWKGSVLVKAAVRLQLSTKKWFERTPPAFYGCFWYFWRTYYWLRWPITSTTITSRITVNKENLTNQKVLYTYKKGLPPYKQDLLTYTKKDSLIYTKNPRQTPAANSHSKFSWQLATANSGGKFPR